MLTGVQNSLHFSLVTRKINPGPDNLWQFEVLFQTSRLYRMSSSEKQVDIDFVQCHSLMRLFAFLVSDRPRPHLHLWLRKVSKKDQIWARDNLTDEQIRNGGDDNQLFFNMDPLRYFNEFCMEEVQHMRTPAKETARLKGTQLRSMEFMKQAS